MKAVGYQISRPVSAPDALLDIEIAAPEPGPRDLLVEVKAIAVNPVDTKIRQRVAVEAPDYKILGWDAAGVVQAVGNEVSLFKPGDEVWYAGAIDRPGCNAEYQCVDERIVAHKPASLEFAAAASMPLTALTAWELLFDRLAVDEDKSSAGNLLIIGAAGGVGSILTQLASKLTGLNVIGTASRAETREWAQRMGAHQIIDHSQPFRPQLESLGIHSVDYIASLMHTDDYFTQYAELITPQGKIALIDDPQSIDIRLLKQKSVSLHWEFMYTRSLFKTEDMSHQHEILQQLSKLVDENIIQATANYYYDKICAANLIRAHRKLESGNTIGKIVLEGF